MLTEFQAVPPPDPVAVQLPTPQQQDAPPAGMPRGYVCLAGMSTRMVGFAKRISTCGRSAESFPVSDLFIPLAL
jgi:hypothetical protein